MKNPFSKKTEATEEGAAGVSDSVGDSPEKTSNPAMKKTLIAVAAAGVLAISGVLMLVNYVKSAEDLAASAADLPPTTDVVVVVEPIKAGTSIEQLRNDGFRQFEVDQYPEAAIPPGAVTSIEQLDGLGDVITDANLSAGETVLGTRFVPRETFATRSVVVDVPTLHHQASFRIAPDRVLGGLIRPGDDISISSTFGARAPYPDLATIVLTSVEVLNVQIEGGPGAQSEEVSADRDTVAAAPTSEYLVTVAVTAEELTKLHFAIDYGRILVAAATDDPDADVPAVVDLTSIIKDAGGSINAEGNFEIEGFERPDTAPRQMANVDTDAATVDSDPADPSGTSGESFPPEAEDTGQSLRAPQGDPFGTSTDGEG